MKNFPKVFIVVLNYNGKDVIKRCLSSVFKVDYPNFEVVMVDNNSTDGSLEIARSNFSKADFIKNEENLGFASGNNIGIRFALERMADYILVLNNDTEVEKDSLTRLIEASESDEKIGIASPVIFNGNTKQVWFSGGKIKWLRMKTEHVNTIKTNEYYETDFISGCAMLVKAEVFKKIGLFDEDFFLYWEDADFSYRAAKDGFKRIMVSGAWVYHFENSEKHKDVKNYWLVISGLIFFKKNASFWMRPWLVFYIAARRAKNWLDIKVRKSKPALAVQKAYQDYKKAKF